MNFYDTQRLSTQTIANRTTWGKIVDFVTFSRVSIKRNTLTSNPN